MPVEKKKATGKTMPIVYAIWALVVGTAFLWWIHDQLWPVLIEDGSLEGDILILAVAGAVGVVIAAPSVFMSRAASLIEAWKEYRGTRPDQ